jgi:hypothetical protein
MELYSEPSFESELSAKDSAQLFTNACSPTCILIAKSSPNGSPSSTPKSRKSGFFGSKKEKKGSKGKLDKTQIGLPSNFRHLGHIGWDPNKGFNVCVLNKVLHTT